MGVNTKYTKPANGIPETDLSSDVRSKLGGNMYLHHLLILCNNFKSEGGHHGYCPGQMDLYYLSNEATSHKYNSVADLLPFDGQMAYFCATHNMASSLRMPCELPYDFTDSGMVPEIWASMTCIYKLHIYVDDSGKGHLEMQQILFQNPETWFDMLDYSWESTSENNIHQTLINPPNTIGSLINGQKVDGDDIFMLIDDRVIPTIIF